MRDSALHPVPRRRIPAHDGHVHVRRSAGHTCHGRRDNDMMQITKSRIHATADETSSLSSIPIDKRECLNLSI
eukprot:3508374-Amphidinium_carterae.1